MGRTASERPGSAAAACAAAVALAPAWLTVATVAGFAVVAEGFEGEVARAVAVMLVGEVDGVGKDERKEVLGELDAVGAFAVVTSADASGLILEDVADEVEEAELVEVRRAEEEAVDIEPVVRRLVARRVETAPGEDEVRVLLALIAAPVAKAGGICETTGVEAKNGRRPAVSFVTGLFWRAARRE